MCFGLFYALDRVPPQPFGEWARQYCDKTSHLYSPSFDKGLLIEQRKDDDSSAQKEAAQWYLDAAKLKDHRALCALGAMHFKGKGGVPLSTIKAAKLWKEASAAGNPNALAALGWLHVIGQGGMKRSDSKAVDMWSKAAERKHPYAIAALGGMRIEGRGGLLKDLGQAVSSLRIAADHKVTDAMLMLSLVYFSPENQRLHNDEIGLYWCRKAVYASMNPTAMWMLSHIYDGEIGSLHKDKEMAAYWCKEAAYLGDADAMEELALRYWGGDGVVRDKREAMRWQKRSEETRSSFEGPK